MSGIRGAFRGTAKSLALSMLSGAGAIRVFEWLSSRGLLALTYHRVVPREGRSSAARPSNSVFCDEFEEQMRFVTRHYHVPAAQELRSILEGRAATPRRSVAITFDDGYENNFLYALPILRRQGLHAIVFVATSLIGQSHGLLWFDRLDALLGSESPGELIEQLRVIDASVPALQPGEVRKYFKRMAAARQNRLLDRLEELFHPPNPDKTLTALMTWDQVRSMVAAGLTIGSHTANHQILSAVSAAESALEVGASRQRIEAQTGQPCWCFAYPNGTLEDFRPADEAALRGAGYSCAFTQISGSIAPGTPRYRLPRIPIPDSGDLRIFRFHVSGMHRLRSRRTGS